MNVLLIVVVIVIIVVLICVNWYENHNMKKKSKEVNKHETN